MPAVKESKDERLHLKRWSELLDSIRDLLIKNYTVERGFASMMAYDIVELLDSREG